LLIALLAAGTMLLAYANGSNDNFKATATVYGSGTLSYRASLSLATAAQVAGSVTSVLLAGALLEAFSGKGLVPPAVIHDPRFLVAVAAGGAATVLVATRLGLPVSTTHALIGGLLGASLALDPGDIAWGSLAGRYATPLLVSPLLAAIAAAALYPVARFQPSTAVDRAHTLSALALGFARGLNDTPKVLALLVAAGWSGIQPRTSLVVVSLAMAVGGFLHSRRVAETLGHRITSVSRSEGLLANAVSSSLVIGASLLGSPVSTTHVSTGAIFGIGVRTGAADRRVVAGIAAAWVATLPLSAIISAGLAAMMAIR